ncbi:MAG: glycosyltransferase family 2 protein, partial [Bacteroidales bacterium]|nr:glycosyltransferase family 2 protein [Bacteroidales bacterium]
MLLSIVIVNYNVKSFLAQCLRSVQQSEGVACGVDYEVFVVDNHSVDGSVEMIREKFPWVRLIANQENTGFAKANNQAVRQSVAKYVLLLNPDTLIENDTLQKCLAFMESHPDAGGLGVKMLDGQGRYLKESKRGIPTPSTAFYKMTGLCKFFPRSKRFASYYMGHLSPDEIHSVEILSGAFMLLRRETLDKVGLLDETFFMYGEDIDLSYRILQGGYRNYYFPHTHIIHYKGESTRKGSLNYVLVFYKAMEIFVEKHFSKGRYKLYLQIIRIAIWLRAALSMLSIALQNIFLPIVRLLRSLRRNKNYLIIGGNDEQARVQAILQDEGIRSEHIFGMRVNDALSVLNGQIQANRIGEVIFCAKDLNFDQILLLVRI